MPSQAEQRPIVEPWYNMLNPAPDWLRRLRPLTVFAACYGLSTTSFLQDANIQIVGGCEINQTLRTFFEHLHPEAMSFSCIRDLITSLRNNELQIPQVDIFEGTAPCQTNSIALHRSD